MRLLLLFLGIGLPVTAAYAATARALRGPADLAARALRAGVALPLGIGAGSLFAFAWLAAGGSLGRAYATADFLLFGGAIAALRRRPLDVDPEPRGRPSIIDRVAIGVAALTLGAAGVALAQATIVAPTGGWDAWAVWNNHARFLYRGGEGWTALFDEAMSFSHNEYPLLLPAAVARLWAYSGETFVEPAIVAGLFTVSAPLAAFGAVARRSGYVAGATALMLLVGTGSWLGWGPAQYADVPLASCVVAAAAAVVSARREASPLPARVLALAGALLGLAAWTKDEGVVLGALFAAWSLAVSGRQPLWRRAVAFASGAALPLAARAYFQLALAPRFAALYTAEQAPTRVVGRLLAADRWALLAGELPRHLPGAETWLAGVAIVAATLLGARWRELPRSPVIPALAAWGAFVLVYAATPLDLRWHLGTSASRVLLQPWPALLLGVFALVPPVAGPEVAGEEVGPAGG